MLQVAVLCVMLASAVAQSGSMVDSVTAKNSFITGFNETMVYISAGNGTPESVLIWYAQNCAQLCLAKLALISSVLYSPPQIKSC